MMEDDLWRKTTDTYTDTDTNTDTDTDTNTDGGGGLLVKFPFKRVFPTAAVCAAVRHFCKSFDNQSDYEPLGAIFDNFVSIPIGGRNIRV